MSRLLGLPGRTLVYPAHDYHGHHVSSIADERRHNPRLQFKTIDEYVALMDGLRPTHVDHMDVVESPSLRRSGVLLRELAGLRAALAPESASPESDSPEVAALESDRAGSDAFSASSFASAEGWSPHPPAVRSRVPSAAAEETVGESAPSSTGRRVRRGVPR